MAHNLAQFLPIRGRRSALFAAFGDAGPCYRFAGGQWRESQYDSAG
jgi:hypothetical protein